MLRAASLLILAMFFCAAKPGAALPVNMQLASQAGEQSALWVPAGSQVDLVVIRPIWTKGAKPGDIVYLQTNFPVASGDTTAIPAGTYVEGAIDSITPPTRKSNLAQLQIHFTKMIFADGTLLRISPPGEAGADAEEPGVVVSIQLSRENDLLLDNGAQVEWTLTNPLKLDAQRVAQAIPLSIAPQAAQFRSATHCRPTAGTPGTPGTPDTVIPGSPGTPDTVIPGMNGMPATVIPGIPATPDTIIPGSPGFSGTPGSVCPAAPLVLSTTSSGVRDPTNASPQTPSKPEKKRR